MELDRPAGQTPALDRAIAAMREEPTDAWPPVADRIRRRTREIVRPAPDVVTFGPDGSVERDSAGSRVLISTRIVRRAIHAAVESSSRALASIDVEVEDQRCARLRVGLLCRYGTVLEDEGSGVRQAIASLLADRLIGPDPDFDHDRDIEVEIIDVVEGDPRRS